MGKYDALFDEEPVKPKAGKYAALFEEEEKAGTTLVDALFPRRAKAQKEDAGLGRQMAARAADVASLPLSAAYAGAETLTGKGSFKENLANRQGGSIVKRIATDPATLPATLATGGGSIMAQAARAGAAGAAAHQTENVGEGRQVEPGKAALEVITSLLLPGAAKKGGELAKATGKGFMQSILKPSKFLREQEKIDMGDLIETLGSKNPIKGSMSGMAKKASKLEEKLGKKYGEIVDANAAVTIDPKAALSKTGLGFQKGFQAEKKYGDVIDGLEKGGDYWDDILQRQGVGPKGNQLREAVNLRQTVGRRGKYNANKDPRELEGEAQFARELYKNLSDQEAKAVPALVPVKKELEKLYPLREAVENAKGRTANNFYPGLTDNIALSAAAQAQKPEMSIPGLLLFLANRTVKNPAAATATYQAGKALESPGAGQKSVREAVKRMLGQLYRGDEED